MFKGLLCFATTCMLVFQLCFAPANPSDTDITTDTNSVSVASDLVDDGTGRANIPLVMN